MILKHRVDRDPLRGLATTNHQQGRTREGTDERECTNLIGGGCGAEHESVGEVPPREPSSSSSLRNASFQRYSEEKQQRHQALHLPHPDERERGVGSNKAQGGKEELPSAWLGAARGVVCAEVPVPMRCTLAPTTKQFHKLCPPLTNFTNQKVVSSPADERRISQSGHCSIVTSCFKERSLPIWERGWVRLDGDDEKVLARFLNYFYC
jgi:hypothetical protein